MQGAGLAGKYWRLPLRDRVGYAGDPVSLVGGGWSRGQFPPATMWY